MAASITPRTGPGPRSNNVVRQFVIDVLSLLGIGLGAGKSAAEPVLDHIRQDAYIGDPIVALTPAEAALGVVKNATPALDWVQEARHYGISPERFAALVALTGNPPGPETLYDLWNRGFVDEGQVDQGLKEGYLKNEWIAFVKRARRRLLTPTDYVQAEVQAAPTSRPTRELAAMAGLEPSEYDTALWLAGNPPGPMTTLVMWARGIFSRDEAVQALKESRLKDKYIDQFLELVRRRIPMRTINTLLRNGALDETTALQYLKELGFTAADAAALIKGATASKTAPHKALTVANVQALYETHRITRAAAVTDLVRVGYSGADAGELLDLADATAIRRLQAKGVNKLQTLFVAHRITESKARADLGMLGVDAAQVTALMAEWAIEREANVKVLTEAQLRLAVGKQLLTTAQYVAALVADGYSQADATLLAAAHGLP